MSSYFIDLLQKFVKHFKLLTTKNPLLLLLKDNIHNNYSVLDVGCGRSSCLKHVKKAIQSFGLDFYKPYLTKSKNLSIHNFYILADVCYLPFKSNSFDCAIAIEVIEHLDKAKGLKMIKEMERVAKSKLILTTPNGFLTATPGPEDTEDNPQERHISGYNVNELRRLGFKVYGLGIKMFKGARIISWISYYYPVLAFQLFCVKNSTIPAGSNESIFK